MKKIKSRKTFQHLEIPCKKCGQIIRFDESISPFLRKIFMRNTKRKRNLTFNDIFISGCCFNQQCSEQFKSVEKIISKRRALKLKHTLDTWDTIVETDEGLYSKI